MKFIFDDVTGEGHVISQFSYRDSEAQLTGYQTQYRHIIMKFIFGDMTGEGHVISQFS